MYVRVYLRRLPIRNNFLLLFYKNFIDFFSGPEISMLDEVVLHAIPDRAS